MFRLLIVLAILVVFGYTLGPGNVRITDITTDHVTVVLP
jgi:hypothetical protein